VCSHARRWFKCDDDGERLTVVVAPVRTTPGLPGAFDAKYDVFDSDGNLSKRPKLPRGLLDQITAARQVRGGALTFRYRPFLDHSLASYIGAQCPQLRRITCESGHNARYIARWLPWVTEVVLDWAWDEHLLQLAEGCRELRLLHVEKARSTGLPELAGYCRDLREYHVGLDGHVTLVAAFHVHCEHADISDDDFEALAQNCPLLRSVVVTRTTGGGPALSLSDRGLLALVTRCVQLDVVTLWSCAVTASGVAEATRIAVARAHWCRITVEIPPPVRTAAQNAAAAAPSSDDDGDDEASD
jgi:hypothetical protein